MRRHSERAWESESEWRLLERKRSRDTTANTITKWPQWKSSTEKTETEWDSEWEREKRATREKRRDATLDMCNRWSCCGGTASARGQQWRDVTTKTKQTRHKTHGGVDLRLLLLRQLLQLLPHRRISLYVLIFSLFERLLVSTNISSSYFRPLVSFCFAFFVFFLLSLLLLIALFCYSLFRLPFLVVIIMECLFYTKQQDIDYSQSILVYSCFELSCFLFYNKKQSLSCY